MAKRYLSSPKIWLMTDERMGDRLMPSICALPRGSGVIFRHYGLGAKARRQLFEQVRKVTRARRHVLLLSGPVCLALGWRADGAHGHFRGAISSPVHSIPERIAAERRGARLIFVSPIFSTASHPGKGGIGPRGFGVIRRGGTAPAIALGGMTPRRFRQLARIGAHGWAAIDALTI